MRTALLPVVWLAVCAAGVLTSPVANAAADELLVLSNRDGAHQITTLSADGTQPRRLVAVDGGIFDACWSPDGLKVAYVASSGPVAHVFVYDLTSSSSQQLTVGTHLNAGPRWSPDGKRIVFVSHRDGNPEIYVMAADGGGQQRLTNYGEDDIEPTWSPDGKRIAFLRNVGRLDLWVMNADGSDQVNLTNTRTVMDTEPVWTPDGSRIVFTSRRDSVNEVYSIRPDGTDRRDLTRNGAFNRSLTFSPDGSRIAFASNAGRSGVSNIWVMAADGSNPRQLTNATLDEFAPSWSLDGEQIFFVSMRTVRPAIFSVSARGGEATQITFGPSQDTHPLVRPVGQHAAKVAVR